MKPLTPRDLLRRVEDDDVPSRRWGGRRKHLLFPCCRTPPSDHLKIVDRHAAMIEEEGQQTDRVAQIVQVRRVRRRTPKDETHWRPLHGISEWPVRAQQLVPGVPLSKIIQDIGMRGTGIAGELQPGRKSLRSVRRTRQASAT